MNHSAAALALEIYFGLNFVCALVLHLHAVREAHLRLRFLDVLMHFSLLTLFALPALLVVMGEALFGREGKAELPVATQSAHAGARAA